MNKMIQIQQVLHGYNKGHQLLGSSIQLSFSDRRLMDFMSDGAGIDLSNCQEGYITGYPLPDSNKYVLAKTWYADDMPRPGCVWTHSLLLDIDDIDEVKFPREIIESFRRPILGKYDGYTDAILLNQQDDYNNDIDIEKLQSVIYTIYGTDIPRYVEIENNSYSESIFFVICSMPRKLLLKFSFCTNSLINRCIGGIPFSYQMVMRDNIYKVCVKNIKGKVFRQTEGMLVSPAWAREYAKAISLGNLGDIELFLKIFNTSLQNFSVFNQLLRLYFITQELDEKFSFLDYYDILKKVSEDNYLLLLDNITIELICGTYFDDLFLDDFKEMIDITEANKKKLRKEDRGKLAKKLLHKNIKRIPEFLGCYIHGTLNKQSAAVAHEIMIRAKADELEQISSMDHDIVIVAVATNNKLIMSRKIWSMPRDYQCDIINVLGDSISYDKWLDILKLIFQEDKEDVSEAIYNKMGERLVPALLELFQQCIEIKYTEQIFVWDKYLLVDQINLTCNLLKITHADLKKHLLMEVNTYSEKIRNSISVYEWIELFKSISFESDNEKRNIAIKMLPLILDNYNLFANDIVSFVFVVIHQLLAESRIAYEEWNMFENMLPTVDLCYAWDKCLRLRKAFEDRGYDINELFREYKM